MRVLIQDGRVAQIVPDDLDLPSELQVVDAPDDVKMNFGFRDGKFVRPNVFGALPGELADYPENYINAQLAKQELLLSDRVCVRCYEEDATPVPQEWRDYRATLRSIIVLENDTTTPPIPVPPRPTPPFPFDPEKLQL
jgi:hypothetical protein